MIDFTIGTKRIGEKRQLFRLASPFRPAKKQFEIKQVTSGHCTGKRTSAFRVFRLLNCPVFRFPIGVKDNESVENESVRSEINLNVEHEMARDGLDELPSC